MCNNNCPPPAPPPAARSVRRKDKYYGLLRYFVIYSIDDNKHDSSFIIVETQYFYNPAPSSALSSLSPGPNAEQRRREYADGKRSNNNCNYLRRFPSFFFRV